MGFLDSFLKKLTKKVTAPADMGAAVKAVFPDAIVSKDVFPTCALNMTMVVLPSVEQGLPDSLKDIIKKKDGDVTVVFTGSTARAIRDLNGDVKTMAKIASERLLSHTKIDEAVKGVFDKATAMYNKVMPGEDLTTAQLAKKVLGLLAALLSKQETFKSAQELYKAIVETYLLDGRLVLSIPPIVAKPFAKMGLDKVFKNDAVEVAMKVFEVQINSAVEAAFKELKGDIQVY